MAQKSVYLSWLICKFINHELSIFPPVSDHDLASSKNACDITLKHVLLPKLNLWQNQAMKLHQILFWIFSYHNCTRTFVILNHRFSDIWFSGKRTQIYLFSKPHFLIEFSSLLFIPIKLYNSSRPPCWL